MRKDTYYQEQFQESGSLTDLFYFISFFAWKRLKSYSMQPIPVSEVEITNTLVHEIWDALMQESVRVPIRFFHAKDENTNGNDLEIVIPVDDNRYIILPCQAKRLYVNEAKDNLNAKYKAIHHRVKKETPEEKEQICCLLDYAQKWSGFPIYLFYNYTEYPIEVSSKYPHKELYGCTLVSAYHVFENHSVIENQKRKMIPFTFQDILSAKPLLSFLDEQLLTKLTTFFGTSTSFNKLKFYTQYELLKQERWHETCPPFEKIDRRSDPRIIPIEEILSNDIEEYPFNPKYRIMILTKPEILRDKNIRL
jgi:hypothetical protein